MSTNLERARESAYRAALRAGKRDDEDIRRAYVRLKKRLKALGLTSGEFWRMIHVFCFTLQYVRRGKSETPQNARQN